MDLTVKWRFFRSLTGGGDDPEAEQLYRWHIAKRHDHGFVDGDKVMAGREETLDRYVDHARLLLRSMQRRGFDANYPIPLDPGGELLGGAHRTACAIALNCPVVVEHRPERVWAPAWDIDWFRNAGMDDAGIRRLLNDWETMCRSS